MNHAVYRQPDVSSLHDAIEEGDAQLDAMRRTFKNANQLPKLPETHHCCKLSLFFHHLDL